MTVQLKPGKLGGAGDAAARPSDFAGSMADLIEQELDALMQAEGRPALTIDNTSASRDRRILLVAIARGVVRHLAANPAAFVITDPDGGGGTASLTIETEL